MSKIRIRKRGNTYSYSFDISKNPRRMKEKGGFATEDEAFDAGVKAYTDWKSGNIGITSERVKLRDYLASWLENVVRPNVKRTTFKSYHNAIGSRITPQIGDIYLQELRPRDIDLWVNELAHAGLSQGTIRQTKTVLSIALKYAIYPAELITANPTTGINIPRSAPHKVVMRTIITPEQFAAIPESNKYYPLLKILYHTGLRISEALGLTWDDIDLETGAVSISRQRMNVRYALYRLGLNSHSFRHTHATRLIESGAKPVDVAARLGHADATITQNLYAHDTDDMQQETARIFERFVDK